MSTKPTKDTDTTSPSGNEAGNNESQRSGQRPTVAEAVELINGLLLKQDENRLEIGRIVVVGVEADGGSTVYGEDTIGSLVEEHDLQCTAEHLRKCWHYYRLMRDCGETLVVEHPTLKFGHLYQISRLYQLEEEHGAEVVAEAIRAMAHKAMADGKGGKPIPADALARAVTTHIKSLKRHGSADRGGSGDGLQEGASAAQAGSPFIVLSEAVAGLNQGISDALDLLPTVTADKEYRHAVALQTNVDRVAAMHVALLGHIVHHDPQSIVIPMARKRVIALAGLVGLTVVETGASEQKEVLP